MSLHLGKRMQCGLEARDPVAVVVDSRYCTTRGHQPVDDSIEGNSVVVRARHVVTLEAPDLAGTDCSDRFSEKVDCKPVVASAWPAAAYVLRVERRGRNSGSRQTEQQAR